MPISSHSASGPNSSCLTRPLTGMCGLAFLGFRPAQTAALLHAVIAQACLALFQRFAAIVAMLDNRAVRAVSVRIGAIQAAQVRAHGAGRGGFVILIDRVAVLVCDCSFAPRAD